MEAHQEGALRCWLAFCDRLYFELGEKTESSRNVLIEEECMIYLEALKRNREEDRQFVNTDESRILLLHALHK
jgi:hypothetical protein